MTNSNHGQPVLFISHASEDKDGIARPLAEALTARGLTVWYDEYSLSIGDDLQDSIDRGLESCSHGIVILSPAFFIKKWTKYELKQLVTRQRDSGGGIILPILHDMSADEVAEQALYLKNILARSTAAGISSLADEIALVARRTLSASAPPPAAPPLPPQSPTSTAPQARRPRGAVATLLAPFGTIAAFVAAALAWRSPTSATTETTQQRHGSGLESPMSSSRATSPTFAYANFNSKNLHLYSGSFNISSLIDNGTFDFSLVFDRPHEDDAYVVMVQGSSQPTYTVHSHTATGVRIEFSPPCPDIIRIECISSNR